MASLSRIAATALLLAGGQTLAAPDSENDHFAPLLGTWHVEARRLQRDGKTWVSSEHPAEWRFYRILDDQAIQDDWIDPAPHIDVPKGARTFGTNIRIYNSELETWEMAWIATTARKALTFTATFAEGEIVMRALGATPARRNIFHNFTANHFSWRQEWTFDGGESWAPVVYMEATRTAE